MSFGATNNKPEPGKKLANIDADQVNTNQIGLPVPYMAGRRRFALHYIAPVYNPLATPVTTSAGKGSDEQITGYNYSGDLAAVLCLGGRLPLEVLFRHIMESEIVWENAAGLALADSETPITITDRGQTWIHRGDPDQAIDTHVLTPIGVPPPIGSGTPPFDPRDFTTWPGYNPWNDHPDPP